MWRRGWRVALVCVSAALPACGHSDSGPTDAELELALADAAIPIASVDVIKTHNPFAVNDAYFARQMGVQIKDMNNYGSSLIFGHPQGPTGARLISEMIEELRLRGGGIGLFTGCAAGDSGAALVVLVED